MSVTVTVTVTMTVTVTVTQGSKLSKNSKKKRFGRVKGEVGWRQWWWCWGQWLSWPAWWAMVASVQIDGHAWQGGPPQWAPRKLRRSRLWRKWGSLLPTDAARGEQQETSHQATNETPHARAKPPHHIHLLGGRLPCLLNCLLCKLP